MPRGTLVETEAKTSWFEAEAMKIAPRGTTTLEDFAYVSVSSESMHVSGAGAVEISAHRSHLFV